MTQDAPPSSAVSTRRMSLMVLLVVVASIFAVDALARNESLVRWIHSRWVEKWQGSNHCAPHWPYFFPGDCVILDHIPNADFSRGGAYYFGSSNLGTGIMPWSLTPEARELVHDYNVPGSNHTDQGNLIRYLIESEDLLAAGPDKTLVVLAIFYGSSKLESWFPNLFTHGFYTYSREEGMRRTGVPWLYRFLEIEKMRCRWFLVTCRLVLHMKSDLTIDADLIPHTWTKPYAEKEFKKLWTKRMGPDWKENMVVELKALEATLDLLKAKKVPVEIALLPVGSWPRELPFHKPFVEGVKAITDRQSVPLHDFSELLTDDEFVDQIHMNHAGALEINAALTEIALRHLRRTGAIR